MWASLRAAKSPLLLLSGCWSAATNFVLTFAGLIPFMAIQKEAKTLTQPFPDVTLVPSKGLSKVTFNRVPTKDMQVNDFFNDQQLLCEVRCNPICVDLQFILLPWWLHPTQLETGPFSSLSFAFLDPNGSITLIMSKSHLAMFGKVITFKRWLVRPPMLQCPHCHKLGHQGAHCTLPKDALCCHLCGRNHQVAEHPLKCKHAKNHSTPGKCDCQVACIICKEAGHSARDLVCPAWNTYKVLAFNAEPPITENPHHF
jgi:hypothetical protein